MLLYKYRSPIADFSPGSLKCNTARIFSGSALYYATPASLNDPYEAHIEFDYSASKEKAEISHFRVLRERARLRGDALETMHQTMEQVRRNVAKQLEHIENKTMDFHRYYRDAMDSHGVLSLSENCNNLLMWAHYGSEHKGLCLGFDWAETGLPPAKQVNYNSMYRLVDIWAYTEDELAEIACFQKSIEWAYEREWRSFSTATYESYSQLELTQEAREELERAEAQGEEWLARDIKRKHTFRYRRPKEFGHRAIPFEKKSLKEVIFGARMTEAERGKHVAYITALGYAPTFYQVVRHPQRYALKLRKLN